MVKKAFMEFFPGGIVTEADGVGDQVGVGLAGVGDCVPVGVGGRVGVARGAGEGEAVGGRRDSRATAS